MAATICTPHTGPPLESPALRGPLMTGDRVRIFDHEPDLLDGVDPAVARHLRQRVAAPRVWIEAGPWEPSGVADADRTLALLLLDGLMTRTIDVSGRKCPELLGAGDVLRPWEDAVDGSIPQDASWRALERTSIAVLDERLAAVIARWPSIAGQLLSRTIQRSRSISFHLAIAHVRHADTRLLMLLWHLADRWGRVTPAGVHVPLRLTHELMAHLACMRRPTASSALQRLSRDGEIVRRSDGSWVLLGAPPAERPAGVAVDARVA